MAEQQLNGSDIGAGFKQMHSECVAKRMGRDRLAKAGKLMRLRARLFDGVSGDGPTRAANRE